MAIKLKNKVALGGVFLFALLILVGAVSVYYFNTYYGANAKEIVKDNYETLNYTRDMLREMDELNSKNREVAIGNFEQNLQLQEKNITEPGEKELTASLRKNFIAERERSV